MTETLITPGDVRPPAAWLRDAGTTRVTPEGLTQREPRPVPDPEAVRRDATELQSTSPSSKLLAGQLVAHCVGYGLPLPNEVLRALAVALGLQERYVHTRARRAAIERAYAEGRTTADIAAEHGVGARSVRRLRGREVPPSFDVEDACERALRLTALPPRRHDERQDDVRHMRGQDYKDLWDIVADLTERGRVLPLQVFHAVIVALGLTDGRGRLRQGVVEDVLPKPKDTWEVIGIDRVEPEDSDDDGIRIVAELQKAQPRIGLRAPNLIAQAVEVEAIERVARGHWAEPAWTYQEIADKAGIDFNTVRTWAATDAWEEAVMSRAYDLGEPIRVAIEHEALATFHGRLPPSASELATLVNDTLDARTPDKWSTVVPARIAEWRARLDWRERVDARLKGLRESEGAAKERWVNTLTRQAMRTRTRTSD